ncbi:hypothetical protein KC354_g13125 [Hortaea werneckii]|nr:hypothetical protein KC354_g13125 [Hortaea werneckii]
MVLPVNYHGLECPDILSTLDQFDLLGMDPYRQPRYTYDELLGMARHVATFLTDYERLCGLSAQPLQPGTGLSSLPYRAEQANAMIQYLESGVARGGPYLAVAATYTPREGRAYTWTSSWNPHIPSPFTIRREVAQPIPGRLPYPSDSSPAPLPKAHDVSGADATPLTGAADPEDDAEHPAAPSEGATTSHSNKTKGPERGMSADTNFLDSQSEKSNGSQARFSFNTQDRSRMDSTSSQSATLSAQPCPTVLDDLVKGSAMADQESTRLHKPTAEEVASVPSSSGSVPLGTGDNEQRQIPKLHPKRPHSPPATNTTPTIPPAKIARNASNSMGFVSGGLTNASGSTMQPGSGLLGNAQANQAPNPAVNSPAPPQGLRGPQLTASTSASTGAAPNSSRHIFAQLKKEGHSLKYRSSDIAALPGSCSSALQRKSPTVSVSTPNQAQMATTQATTTPRVAASDLIADAHLGGDIVMSNTGMRREEEASANPTTLKGNAATSEQAPTAVQGEKGIIETEPGMYPTGIPAAPPTPSRSTARTSQGAGPAFPSTSNAIVKIGGEDGKLIQLINGLDEKLSKKLDEFRRSNISTRDENLSNLWKQATRARNKAEVAVLVDAAITAAATVRGKQVQQKADAQARPMIQTLKELRKKEIAKYDIIIGEADQWTKVFQEMKRYLKGP